MSPVMLLMASGPFGIAALVWTLVQGVGGVLGANTLRQSGWAVRYYAASAVPFLIGVVGVFAGLARVQQQLNAAGQDPAVRKIIQAGSGEAYYALYIGIAGSLVLALLGFALLSRPRTVAAAR